MKDGILVTAIGSFSGNTIVASLKKLKEYNVYGCDIYPSIWHAGSEKYRKVFKVPLAIQEAEYVSAIIRICMDYKIKYIIPTTDIEVDTYNLHRKKFEEEDITLCISGRETISVARNKYTLSTFFEKNPYFKTIPTYRSSTDTIENPVFPLCCETF